jgi:hypothetical protein
MVSMAIVGAGGRKVLPFSGHHPAKGLGHCQMDQLMRGSVIHHHIRDHEDFQVGMFHFPLACDLSFSGQETLEAFERSHSHVTLPGIRCACLLFLQKSLRHSFGNARAATEQRRHQNNRQATKQNPEHFFPMSPILMP